MVTTGRVDANVRAATIVNSALVHVLAGLHVQTKNETFTESTDLTAAWARAHRVGRRNAFHKALCFRAHVRAAVQAAFKVLRAGGLVFAHSPAVRAGALKGEIKQQVVIVCAAVRASTVLDHALIYIRRRCSEFERTRR